MKQHLLFLLTYDDGRQQRTVAARLVDPSAAAKLDPVQITVNGKALVSSFSAVDNSKFDLPINQALIIDGTAIVET